MNCVLNTQHVVKMGKFRGRDTFGERLMNLFLDI